MTAVLRRVSALAGSTHPGPTVAVTVVTALLGVAVGLEPWRVIVLGLAMLLDQVSVGLSNDWIDAERDRAVGRADKPIARGEISVGAVRTTAWVTAVAALAVTVPLGAAAAIVHLIALASGWSYNVALKNTAFSVLPFIVTFGLLPALASLALPAPVFAAWWALAAGALLGVAAHFANVLPDLDDDRRTGIQGLPHRLGARASIAVTWSALALSAVSIAVGSGGTPIALVGAGVSVLIAIVGFVAALRLGIGRWLFRLVIVAALVDVGMLVLAGSRIVG